MHEAHKDKYKRFGSILKEEYQRGKPIIHVFDPSDFETIFRNQGKYPIRPPNEFVRHYRLQNPGKYPNVGMAHMLGEEWYRQRQTLTPTLMKLSVIQNHIPAQNAICDDFIKYLWHRRDPSSGLLGDLQNSTYRLALESICMMCLDSRLHCLSPLATTTDGNALIAATKKLFESYNELYYGLPIWKYFKTKSYRKLDAAESAIYDIASKYIEQSLLRQRQDISLKSESVLDTLLSTSNLDEKDAKITIIDFIAGGIFTVSNSLTYLLYHLARNPNVQQRLYEELSAVLGDGNAVTAEHLSQMPYLKACVKESFRLNSTVPGIMRILPKDVVLSGYHVPAGVSISAMFLCESALSVDRKRPMYQ